MKMNMKYVLVLILPFSRASANKRECSENRFSKTLKSQRKTYQLWGINNLHMVIRSITQPKRMLFVYFAVAIKIQFDETNEQFPHKLQ